MYPVRNVTYVSGRSISSRGSPLSVALMIHARRPLTPALKRIDALTDGVARAYRAADQSWPRRPRVKRRSTGTLAGTAVLAYRKHHANPMRSPEYLRKQAEKCRRLAGQMTNTPVAEQLAKLASEYEAEAEQCETCTPPDEVRGRNRM
jgi:hypothetical protein